ncbi:MAG: DUF2339 domain-containing protein [Desulfobulbus sp.]|nr:DUF2339 domain-containing protein [Desulfobulbus sp.]
MRLLFFLVAIAIAAIAGFSIFPYSSLNAILTAVVAYLLLEVFSLRRRITRLEQRPVPTSQKPQAAPLEETDDIPLEDAEPPCTPQAAPVTAPYIPRRPVEILAHVQRPSPLSTAVTPLLKFITGGNPVLKIGLVVFFFGVAFLLKYAAQKNLLPIELRLAGVALGGLAMLVLGWRLRCKHLLYGLSLEGGGIGVLYLVVFAASKVYPLLPMPMALAIMVGLVAFSGLLSVLQESKGLAVSGSIGGFLAPVLMSTGGGSHVLLFSYYALLGSGILGIGWFKAWRELNLVGLAFTFGLFSLWAGTSYSSDLFASTEPFLILFFLMYCLIAVLFALRQPLKLRGFIDGPQVFGLPIVCSSLQAYLVHDFRYGMACSALALGAWYVGLARLLWNRMGDGMRLLTEVFLALGVVFASLSIPLGLDPHWTTASWALEGAAMIWVGVRQNRLGARIFGLILQAGAALAFLEHTDLPTGSMIFANRVYLGCALIGIAALFSSYWFDRLGEKVRSWEHPLPLLLLGWGLLWWYTGGLMDLERHRLLLHPQPKFLLYACLTSAALTWLCRRYRWQRLSLSLLLLLPMMLLVYAAQFLDGSLLLQQAGWLAWPLAFSLQYGLIKRYEHLWPARTGPLMHCLSLWLLLLALATEIAFRVQRIDGLAESWSAATWAVVPVFLLYLLEFKGQHLTWPVERHAAIYHGIASDVPVFALLLWCFTSFALSGDPAPLPYIPLLNPLELIELTIFLLAILRWLRGRSVWPPKGQLPLLGLLAFAGLNVVTARSVHFYNGTWYCIDALFASPVFQAAIAALWALLALSLTVLGARKEQRPTWLVGAGLLGLVVCKLFVIDLSGTGSIGRIISFLVVGMLMLVIGYFAPLPPKSSNEPPHAS